MTRSCGNCKYFASWPNDGGLCEKHDTRTTSDYGHRCKDFKGIRYTRKEKFKKKIKTSNETG